MTEETDVPQDGADAIVQHETLDKAEVVETPATEASADTAEQQTEAEETGQADETSEAPKRKPWWEKRFDELTADKHAERRRAEAAEHRLRALEQQATPQRQGPPSEDQFANWDDYEAAKVEYLVDQRIQAKEAERTQRTVISTHAEREAKFTEAHPDYLDKVTFNESLPVSNVMASVIMESDLGPEVAYHLGTNPGEAARIAALPHHRQAAELGKLEAILSQPKAPTRNPPPPPPQTVSGVSAGLNKTPDEMTMTEYKKWREASQG